jgi:RimJ/RimL family protein N-acetyltransferase
MPKGVVIMDVYIRPLLEKDALTSWMWRNDPEVWTYTGSRPNLFITKEIELEWIRRVLKDEDAKRFAICLSETHEYIGNVQLTNIENNSAQFHIFIGEKEYWGRGVSTSATKLILDYAIDKMDMKKIYLIVKKENIAAIKSYEKNGFKTVSYSDRDIRMEIDLSIGTD